MNTSNLVAIKIVKGLDKARRLSSQQRPVDEVALISAAIEDAMAKYEMALRKIAAADTYKGADSPSTKLGRAMDIARLALGKIE